MRRGRDLTVLWALRSPCKLGCDYCYFGTLEEHRDKPPITLGELSHLPHGDRPFSDIAAFLDSVERSRIGRVFLAGGEPLIWPRTPQVIDILTRAGVGVVVCTNGLPLNRESVRAALLEPGVSAVSVSLDSADPGLNDRHRRPRREGDGWPAVVAGIRALVADRDRHAARHRGTTPLPAIGIYSVVTRRTLPGMVDTARLAASLGVDYFVPQPISLAPDHPLHGELVLRPDDEAALSETLDIVYDAGLPLGLPSPWYPTQVASTLRHELQLVHGCFGGSRLAFVEPDGTVWDCPSRYRITATRDGDGPASIVGTTAETLFPRTGTPAPCDCPFYSGDCVNMWPLVEDFDRFLNSAAARPGGAR